MFNALIKYVDTLRDKQTYLWTAIFLSGGGGITIMLNNIKNVPNIIIGITAFIFSGLLLKHFFKGENVLVNGIALLAKQSSLHAYEKYIDTLRDKQNYLWTAIFLTGGGAVTIILSNIQSLLNISIGLIGIILCLTFVKNFFAGDDYLLDKVNKLNKLEKE